MKRTILSILAMLLIYSVSVLVLTSPDVIATTCQGLGMNYMGPGSTGPGPEDTCCKFTQWDVFGGRTQACIPTVSAQVTGNGFVDGVTPSTNPPTPLIDDWWMQRYVVKVCGIPGSPVDVIVTATNAFASVAIHRTIQIPPNC